ncbi:hypothetical protein F444_22562 [Phytophthora nicotianae P1976]|uniref:Tetrahydrofolate dehydrogenase/cyclohydrolase catalytic domain-containing protein n=1 Tax=Phytophthora nicotianae P1976 TaxID=1317066 RepID=A0A080YXF0_PHYNI|nr:hypothetical protein F444_22562 [Phytophthora nicotianae P1976]
MAKFLDRKSCSEVIESELKMVIPKLSVTSTFAVVIVGRNPDSKKYVRMKNNSCMHVGITPRIHELTESIDFVDVHALASPTRSLDALRGETISSFKNVHGMHLYCFEHLAELKKEDTVKISRLQPCTTVGYLELLTRNGIELAGKDVIVIVRGDLVGLPLSLMLLAADHNVPLKDPKTCPIKSDSGSCFRINYVDDATCKKGFTI